MRLRAFFKYFGAKHRAVAKYDHPKHNVIVEPFAGSAAYALYHAKRPDGISRQVFLYDIDPTIVGLWRWLIEARSEEIMALPLLEPGQRVSELDIRPEARALIGFWMRTGSPTPRDVPSPWAKNPDYADRFWGEHVRARIARQVKHIKHWQCDLASYQEAPNFEATWFIDPPYQHKGGGYVHGTRGIDFPELGRWVRKRKGFSIVCEQEGADWLPFDYLADVRANVNVKGEGTRSSREVVATFLDGKRLIDEHRREGVLREEDRVTGDR